MTQLLIGRTVEGREMRMHSLLVDCRLGARTRAGAVASGFVLIFPYVNALCFVLCVVFTGAGLELTTRA